MATVPTSSPSLDVVVSLHQRAFQDLLSDVRTALDRDNPEAIARLMRYPLLIGKLDGKDRQWIERKMFVSRYKQIMSPCIMKILRTARLEDFSSKGARASLGEGRIWFAPLERVLIETIDNDDDAYPRCAARE